MLKSKFLRKSRLGGKHPEKALPTEIDVPEDNKTDQTNLTIDINAEKNKKENFFKMPTGNSSFKFNFNIDENENTE